MPEFRGIKITRAQESARHAYRRALEKALRAAAKGRGWRTVQGSPFREKSGWFISAYAAVDIFEESTRVSIYAKPMAIDPIFWDIIGRPQNRDAPLSFRANGAWTCQPPPLLVSTIDEGPDPAVAAGRVLDLVDRRSEEIAGQSIEHFLEHCRVHWLSENRYLPCVVTSLLALGRHHEALEACDLSKQRGETGGFLAPEGSFTDMAARWIANSIDKATRH